MKDIRGKEGSVEAKTLSDVKNRIEKAQKQYGINVKLCNRCKVPDYNKYGHQSEQKDLLKLGKKIENNTAPIAIEPIDDDMDTDEDDDSQMTFAALSIEYKN